MTTTVTLTPKETALLKELREQENICAEKYSRYADEACDGQLKNLFHQIAQTERNHMQTLDSICSGNVPQMNSGSSQQKSCCTPSNGCSQADMQNAKYLCSDALSMEKHVSSAYNTCIFEFTDENVRNALNHIQKEEQEHGKMIYDYMSANGLYGC